MSFQNKKILLGVCGSIAAYKSAFLTRELIRSGASVKIIMTKAACEFITPLTMSTLSKNPVIKDMFIEDKWINHVEYGKWADLMIIAPASANTIAGMANGLCDNMLLATYLSTTSPVFVAPAMDRDMWQHPATQGNMEKIKGYKDHHIIDVEEGVLASGLHGAGRMAEVDTIIQTLEDYLNNHL